MVFVDLKSALIRELLLSLRVVIGSKTLLHGMIDSFVIIRVSWSWTWHILYMCAIEPIARWSLLLFVDLRRALIREFLLSSTVVTSWKISLHGVINSFVDLLLFQRVHCERGISHVCHRNLSQQLKVKRFWGLLGHEYARQNEWKIYMLLLLLLLNFKSQPRSQDSSLTSFPGSLPLQAKGRKDTLGTRLKKKACIIEV